MVQRYRKIPRHRIVFAFTVLFLLLGLSIVNAERATMEDARQVGQNWLNYAVFENGTWNNETAPELMEGEEIFYEGEILGYYLPVKPSGYIVVPILKELPAVKLYAESGYLDMTDNQGFAGMIKEVLHNRVQMYIKRYGSLDASQPQGGDVLFGHEHKDRWSQLLVSESEFISDLYAGKMSRQTTVGPLLTSTWHQRGPYNSRCPVGDASCTDCGSGWPPSSDTVVVGCVATAAAQIMNYWQWPPSGNGGHSYSWDGDQTCGGDVGAATLSANFSDTYDWANMLDSYGGGETQAQIDAAAELCYELAVAFNMDFGVCGSGATTSDALWVYPIYFNYNPSTINKQNRDAHTAAEWFTIIQTDIDLGQPIQYRIKGHSIVCDGWRDTGPEDEIHMNYGWGGGSNAWYTIDNLHCDWDGCDPMVEYLIRGIRPDNLPPVAQCADITVSADENCEATSASIDDGSYDPEGYPLTITQIPSPPYSLGVTNCMLIVEDPQGASDVCYADVTVIDDTPPTAICPEDITQGNDVDQCNAVVTFTIDATDNCPGVTVEASPPPGSTFPVGITEVNVLATDGSGNTGICVFEVEVVDTQNPVVTCPDDIEVTFISPSEATAEYEATATDNCDNDPSVWCVPPSGSNFSIGANLINCYAQDDADNKDTCEFEFHLAYVDIKPRSCPNAFNIKPFAEERDNISLSSEPEIDPVDDTYDMKLPGGVLPVAIPGYESFDVKDIDPATILLNGVEPLRWEYEDVTTPAENEEEYCGCTKEGPDGFMDLTLKFSAEMIAHSLGDVADGEVVQLILTGNLTDDTPLYGGDCLLIRGPKSEIITADQSNGPVSMALIGASPNPFNPTTTLSFRLSHPAPYKMTIFNIAGQVVETISGNGQTGLNRVVWDGSDYTSGVYFYRLEALGFMETKKMLLIK